MVGSWITGVAAVASAPLLAANLGIGMDIIIICFAVIIVGGVGSFVGALIGSIIIGLAESLGLLVLPNMQTSLPLRSWPLSLLLDLGNPW